jgi:hypothetical protein
MLHRFTGPITPACDQYVQYLLTGTNSSVLNRHRRGYNLGGAGFPHHSPRSSQPTVLRFPSMGPARSQVNNTSPIKPKFEFKEPMTVTWFSNLLAIYPWQCGVGWSPVRARRGHREGTEQGGADRDLPR